MGIAKTPFYHEVIRRTIVAFGSLFTDIKIQRHSKDGKNKVIQTIEVPCALGSRDKWFQRTDQDGELDNQVYITLPRISYEFLGMNYNPSRKLGKLNTITCRTTDGGNSIYAPVPYNLEFNLYLVAKQQEDCMQMVEQILPYFSPELTISVNVVPENNIINDIPIILNGVSIEDDYEGDFQTRRTIIYTLNFTVKVNLYGATSNGSIIKKVDINLPSPIDGKYEASQATPVSPIIELFTY